MGRQEDKTEDGVRAVTCLLARARRLPAPWPQPGARACPRVPTESHQGVTIYPQLWTRECQALFETTIPTPN